MRKKNLLLKRGLGALFALALLPFAASAVPLASGSGVIDEPNGFPGVCDAPCYSVQKDYVVYGPDDIDNPAPLAGNNTYVYTLTHVGGSGTPSGFIPFVSGFEIEAVAADVTAASHIATDAGTAPSGVVIDNVNNVVTYSFAPPLANGDMSKRLIIQSPLLPGTVGDTMVSFDGTLSLDAPGDCVGPLDPPVVCALEVEKEGCVVQDPGPTGDDCQGKATAFKFVYQGTGCPGTSNLQSPWAQGCYDHDSKIGSEPVNIVVYGYKRYCSWWRGWCWMRRVIFASASNVSIGDEIMVDAAHTNQYSLGRKVFIKIRTSNGYFVEKVKFRTDCSEPLGPGAQFGSNLITSLTSTQGGTVTLPTGPPDDECVTTIDVSPPPHCIGKIKELQLRYLGGDCSNTNFSQWGSVTCVDPGPGVHSSDPVRLIITDGPPPGWGVQTFFDATVNIGDIVTLNAAALGLAHLPWELGFWTKDGSDDIIQDGSFLSKCQEPLNLGDRVGGLEVFGIDTTSGGAHALGEDVEYTYTVTNPGTSTIDNIDVTDSELGSIATGLSLAPGASTELTVTALIEETTTNTVTVTGDSGGQMCTPAMDDATITVEAPDPPETCTTLVQAVRLRYTGPTRYGVQLNVKAANFMSEPADYGTIDLISGVTELTLPVENGWTIDAAAHSATALGSNIQIWSSCWGDEFLDTTCSTTNPFMSSAPAPKADGGTGAPSSNWFVVDFVQTAP